MTVTALATFTRLVGQESAPHGLWNPTILGVLTVLAAVGLFCGSVYLLLGTNLGARLGFLVAAAGLTGFMVLLTTLWWTSGNSGIDPPHGNSPQWSVVEVVPSLDQSKIPAVKTIATAGQQISANVTNKSKQASSDLLTNLKPAIDAAIVPTVPVAGQEPKPQPFATLGIKGSTDYLLDFAGYVSYAYPDRSSNLFWHKHRYAAVQLCMAKKDAQGNNVIPPACDPLQDTHYIVLSYDYGSLRQPVVAYWFASVLLFALSLLGLHWWERDERARKRAALTPVPAGS